VKTHNFGRLKVPSDDEELIELLEDRADTLTKDRQSIDHQNRINLAFYRGHHWIYPVAGMAGTTLLRRAVYDPRDPKSRVMVTVNKIGPFADRLVARVLKGLPIPEARPVTLEEKDLSAARVGTRILSAECDRIELPDLMTRLYYWVILCRTGFLHPWWDPNDGPVVDEDDEGPLHLGNVCYDLVSPFEMVFAPGATAGPFARWCIRTRAMTAEEIYDMYDYDCEGKDAPKVSTVHDDMATLGDLFGGRETVEKYAVRQFWLPKGKNDTAEEGLVLTWVGDTVLKGRKPFPYDHNHLPFVQFNYLPSPYGLWGHTPIDDMVELNQDYNHLRSREADIRDRLVPKLIAAENSVDAERYSDLVETVFFKSAYGFEPKLTDTPVNWMNMFEAGMNRADMEMGERASINEAMQGDLAGTSPGITVLAQQEAASEPLATPAKQLARGLAEMGWQHLMLVRQYWEEKRIIRTWSEAGRLEVDRFRKADINRELDVHVVTESAMPRSKAGRIELFFQLYEKGIITDPGLLVRILDLPPTDVIAQHFDTDIRQAERENDEIAHARHDTVETPVLSPLDQQPMVDFDGKPVTQKTRTVVGVPEVHELDEHMIHVKVHNDRRKSEEWKYMSDAAKEAHDAHIQVHMAILGSRLQAQQGAQATGVSGAEPPPGGGPMQPNGQPPAGNSPQLEDFAQIGGRAGRPGKVPGVSTDLQAGAIGE
jgi:hypothetical protein